MALTFEERLDRLMERHEALAESVELLHRDLQEMRRDLQETGALTRRNFEIVLDSLRSLENIAASHERRLTNLKDNEDRR